MTLDAHLYRDPMKVLEAKQQRELRERKRHDCQGCDYLMRMFGLDYCERDHTKAGARNLKRCGHYKSEADK